MRLHNSLKNNKQPDWKGYQYMVNRQVKNRNIALLERSTGGWNWKEIADVTYRTAGNEMEVRIPKTALLFVKE